MAGDAEAAGGNSCPTGEGGCLTNEARGSEEVFGAKKPGKMVYGHVISIDFIY